MTREQIQSRLSELNLELPAAPKPVAVYVPAIRSGDTVVVSGQLPLKNGVMVAEGPVGEAVTLEQAQDAARQCALNILAALDMVLDGDFSQIEQILKLEVFVAGPSSFTQQHLVANGASELIGYVLGEKGIHSRAAVGVSSLPLGASVEVAALVRVKNI